MIDALARTGHDNEAIERFQQLLKYANALGLLSEEVDPETATALGNILKRSTTAT